MISKNQIKLVTSLVQKKFRKEHQLFIAEGEKVINELLQSNFELHSLFETEAIFTEVSTAIKTFISNDELKKISALNTPNNCLAVFKIPKDKEVNAVGLVIGLDDIRDPGNLGTIIRLCDWFGISQLICSSETVDIYNPKVIQATMGSIARVAINYLDLEKFIANYDKEIFGTFMDGKNIYQTNLPKEGLIIFGNEANGISTKIEKLVSQKITIPRFGNIQATESLNVATATAIIISEFRRNN